MRIRPATNADAGAIAAIYSREAEARTTTMDTEPRDERWGREWIAAHATPAHPLIVAEDDGVVGWASLSPWSPRRGYAKTVEASVFIREDARGRGIGQELLAALIERARGAGCRVVVGRIERTNAPSRRLAVSLGFASVGVMHEAGEKFGRLLDVEIFELLLRRGDDGIT